MYKKISIIIAGVGLAFAGLFSCKKNNETNSLLSPPSFSEFTLPAAFLKGTYYIKNESGSQFKIPVGITNVSNVDRKIILKDSSGTATAGTQYNFVNTITIPAGKVLDSITVNGLYNGYPTGRKDTLYLKIVGGDVPVNTYNNTYALTMQGYCDVVTDALKGDYANSSDDGGGPYTATVSDVVSTGPTSATLTIVNFGTVWLDDPDYTMIPIKVNINWADPGNFKATIPTQTIDQNFYGYGPAQIIDNGGGTFSSCENTFTLKFKVVVADGSFGNVVTQLKR